MVPKMMRSFVVATIAISIAISTNSLIASESNEQRLAIIEQQIASLTQQIRVPSIVEATPRRCRSCYPEPGWYGGGELLFAKPHLKESFRSGVVDITGTQTLLPFQYDYETSPRVWLGYVGANRIGVRGRYWQFDHSEAPEDLVADGVNFPGAQHVTLIFPAAISTDAPGEILRLSSAIDMTSAEIEATQHFNGWGNAIIASAGIQYASLSQSYRSTVIVGGIPEQLLNWDRRIEGVGPTLGIEATRPLGSLGVDFVAGIRGGMLFAEKDIQRFSVGGPVVPPFAATPRIILDDAEELFLFAQIQLAIQYSQVLASGGKAFLRGSYEGQLWSDSGGNALGYLGMQGFGLTVGVAR